MNYIWPTETQFEYLQNRTGSGPLTMLNLLRYRDSADYADHPGETPCSGRVAYQRYAEKALKLVRQHGGSMIFAGASESIVIGAANEQWDDVLLVQYPDQNAFLAMANSEVYQSFAYHRAAALLDSRLIALDGSRQSYLDDA